MSKLPALMFAVLAASVTTAQAAQDSLSFDFPGNLAAARGLCVVAGSPDASVPVRTLELLVKGEARALGLPVERMDQGECVPIRLKTGNGWLVMSLEPLKLDAQRWLVKVRVSDPHLVTASGAVRDVVVWEHDRPVSGKVVTASAWRPALTQLKTSWTLSRNMK
ncbi:hypothetical protein [Deinococcus pimensis]|uniref:hypothetical protein n=1 Tax=Deinococcus pimensis TaxID=309888 RepID=UPI0004842945|nr:hypothetical protein [Deinococcus pimensis]